MGQCAPESLCAAAFTRKQMTELACTAYIDPPMLP